MVAFIASLIITAALCGIVLLVAKRREPGKPMTWGEAYLAAVFMFLVMLMIYGVVPNQWLQWADKDLGWRSDKLGIPTGPLPFKHHTILAGGIGWPTSIFGWNYTDAPASSGRILLNAQILRDIVAATIYIVFLVAQCWAWLVWQKRGKKPVAKPELTSAYGRPLAKAGATS